MDRGALAVYFYSGYHSEHKAENFTVRSNSTWVSEAAMFGNFSLQSLDSIHYDILSTHPCMYNAITVLFLLYKSAQLW